MGGALTKWHTHYSQRVQSSISRTFNKPRRLIPRNTFLIGIIHIKSPLVITTVKATRTATRTKKPTGS